MSIFKDRIGNPPWNYYFLENLEKCEYPIYLAKLFYLNTGEKLPLKWDFSNGTRIIDKKRCKTFNQKLQYVKLYGATSLMRDLTDKVKVRDIVREKIGGEYLKPVLQICNSYDEIDFKKLPNAFVLKCNHGSKWHYIIKNKEEYLKTPKLTEMIKRRMTGWLEQDYGFWGGFELNYRGIKPLILIEELLRDENETAREIEVYCFNGEAKIIKKVHNDLPDKLTMYDENLNCMDFKFLDKEFLVEEKADDKINQTFVLSKQLAKDFNFVRIDWIIYRNKIYFNEMTFTPNSGFIPFEKRWNKKLGSWIDLEGSRHEF